jgi:hypothetical protein
MSRKTILQQVFRVQRRDDVGWDFVVANGQKSTQVALSLKRLPQVPTLTLLLTLCYPVAALAQVSAPVGPPVAFPQVTEVPIPLQSISGRFSSLNPTKRLNCPNKEAVGRVVSTSLIMVDERFCGRGQSGNVLVNVQFSNPADTAKMVVGSRVTIRGTFKTAEEDRSAEFYANFLIAEKAQLVDADPGAAPAPAFTSYMICQPPELDALAGQLGSELCVQSTIVANLTVTGPALEAAARSPANESPTNEEAGDPNAITCRRDLERSDIHLSSTACARGSYWAWYKAKWRDRLYWTPAPP